MKGWIMGLKVSGNFVNGHMGFSFKLKLSSDVRWINTPLKTQSRSWLNLPTKQGSSAIYVSKIQRIFRNHIYIDEFHTQRPKPARNRISLSDVLWLRFSFDFPRNDVPVALHNASHQKCIFNPINRNVEWTTDDKQPENEITVGNSDNAASYAFFPITAIHFTRVQKPL